MEQKTKTGDICCPEFNPEPWDKKLTEWKNKRFIKDHVRTFFYIPVNFGSTMSRLDKKLKQASAGNPDWLCLSDQTSKWNMDVYVAVDREIPDAENIMINGTFVSKVYEGSYREISNWQKDFDAYCSEGGYKALKNYLWYTTCPKCAKKYGKNYVVNVAQIENHEQE